jgi:hypothetical protein
LIDDYRYSIGRTVVYGHPKPGYPERNYGQYGPGQTVGMVRAVELGKPPEHVWLYRIENLRTAETAQIPESDVFYAIPGKREKSADRTNVDAERIAEAISEAVSPLSSYLSVTVRDLLRREESEERTRREGRDLPVQVGDYVRVRGDLRVQMEARHNHYAKILGVAEPDIAAIESKTGNYRVRRKYRTLMDDGSECFIYDPEIKLYYTADGRTTILNLRAATFLAEAFQDDPPYSLEYSFLEDHVFTRNYLEALSPERLTSLFAALLYVKGKMGLRDLERADRHLGNAPKEFLVDSVLSMSRFDMRRNRNLTSTEIDSKRREIYKFRRLLHGH